MQRSSTLVLRTALLILAAPIVASAAPVTIAFYGTLDEVFDSTPWSDGSVTAGAPFSGYITYDDSASDLDPDPNGGSYVFDAPPWAFHFAIGSLTLDATQFEIALGVSEASEIGLKSDQLNITGPPGSEDAIFSIIDIGFFGATPAISDVLADNPFTGRTWAENHFVLSIEDSTTETGSLTLDAFGTIETVEMIPEPTSFALLCLGLLGLGALRSRR